MATRKTTTVEETQDDIIDKAMTDDAAATADDLTDVLSDLRGLSGSDVEVMIYRIPKGGVRGGWEFVKSITPPIDTISLMDDLRNDWGAGEYALRVRAGGKIKTTKFVSIAAPKSGAVAVQSKNDSNELLQILLAQNASSKSDMMQMTTLMMQSQQASQQQMMQLMTVLLPAMMGGKEKTSELLTAFATLQNMGDKGGGMKEAIETLVAAKSLFAGNEGGGANLDLDGDLLSNGLKLAGPLLGSLANLVPKRQERQEVAQILPEIPTAPLIAIPETPVIAPVPQAERPASRFPVLDLIRDEVLFLFQRRKNPEVAAELVLETLEQNGVELEQLTNVIAAFSVSPNWLEELASEGIDLRADPAWANQFLSSLVQQFSEAGGDDDYSGGGAGGAENNDSDVATSASGVTSDGNSQSGD